MIELIKNHITQDLSHWLVILFICTVLSVLASLFGYDPAEEAKLLIELLHADPSMVMRSALVLAVFTVLTGGGPGLFRRRRRRVRRR